MLSTDLRFRTDRWPGRLLAVLLGEAFLGFLAIVAVALTLFPMLFDIGTAVGNAIQSAQWMIIAWFGLEYVVALVSAPSKPQFLRDPWRWIDLATIVVPLASLLPSVSNVLRSSPVLRLVRLVRLLTLGVRASGIVVRDHQRRAAAAAAAGPALITQRAPDTIAGVPSSPGALSQWLRSHADGWFHVANPTEDDLRQFGAAAGLPPAFLETHFLAATHPHVATGHGYVAVFFWIPQLDPAQGVIERRAMLVVGWKNRVLSLSRARVLDRSEIVAGETGLEDAPLPLRTLGMLLQHVVHENETLVGGFEQQLRALEEVPLRESRPAFFEQTFRLKKHLSAAQWDLWRLKAVLGQLADQRTQVPATSEAAVATFSRLEANAGYLYETIVNTREDLLAVIDLHLNVVSFDMNRVMRVLAVVSVLGLIPAVIGGLLGMNLIDNPWHFTLPQVSFVIVFGMLVGLYFFFVKGWLR